MTTTRKPRKTSKKAEAIQTRKATPQPITNLPPNPFTFEVLSLVVKQRSNAKKVEALKKYEHDSIKALFIWNYDDSVISLLPPGESPILLYKKSRAQVEHYLLGLINNLKL